MCGPICMEARCIGAYMHESEVSAESTPVHAVHVRTTLRPLITSLPARTDSLEQIIHSLYMYNICYMYVNVQYVYICAYIHV